MLPWRGGTFISRGVPPKRQENRGQPGSFILAYGRPGAQYLGSSVDAVPPYPSIGKAEKKSKLNEFGNEDTDGQSIIGKEEEKQERSRMNDRAQSKGEDNKSNIQGILDGKKEAEKGYKPKRSGNESNRNLTVNRAAGISLPLRLPN